MSSKAEITVLGDKHVCLFVEPCNSVWATFSFKLWKVVQERLREEIMAGATVFEGDHAKVVRRFHTISQEFHCNARLHV